MPRGRSRALFWRENVLKWPNGRTVDKLMSIHTELSFFVFSALCMFLCHLSGRQGHKADGDNEVDGEECLREVSLRKIRS